MEERKPLPAPGRITAMTFQKRTLERVNLFIDGDFAMGIPAIEAARLKIGQMLEMADIERLALLDTESRAYDRAVKFLSYRPRSVAEVRRYLLNKKIDELVSEKIVSRLTDLQYLDDKEFARWWIENRTEFSPRGAYAIRQELRVKGVSDTIIAEAIERHLPDAKEPLEKLARRRVPRLSNEDQYSFKRKLSAFLQRRGFSYEDIGPVIDSLWNEMQSERSEDSESID